MKRLTAIIWIMLLSHSLVYGRNADSKIGMMIDSELSQLLSNGAGIRFEYAFSKKWSICAGGYIWFDKTIKSTSHTEDFHNNSLDMPTEDKANNIEDLYRNEIAVRFWPDNNFTGHYVSIGIRHGNNSKTDCILEYGYRIPLLKGSGFTISIKTGLRKLVKTGLFDQQTLNIGIGYDF